MISLANIQFPVYRLGAEKPQVDSGLIFYHRTYKDKSNSDWYGIVDDSSITEPTLSLRRLRILAQGGKLHKIDMAIFFLGDFMKLAEPGVWFIDSNGKLFSYAKSKMATLIYKKIVQVLPINGGHIIEVEGVETRFKCLYAPKLEKFAGLLKIGSSYILYGLYLDRPDDTVRKV